MKSRQEYAVFTITSRGTGYHMLAIESSFGGYSYAWGSPGTDFREFLARLNVDYVLGKMVGRDEVFDGEGTADAIRKEIRRMRRARECSKEEANAAWPESDFDSERDFDEWMRRDELFKDSEPWSFHATCGGRRTQEFAALYKLFWPAFAEELRRDIAACPAPRSTDAGAA
jgi:hypothetical protein